jgi:malate dehydrogenase (oxaloacetate-decarboxylating)(NADP+)
MSTDQTKASLRDAALEFHAQGRPGKLEITATKPLTTQRDLALAYSPGVAEPCLEIQKDPDTAYDYTAKSNTVAVISNGTAVLGLGNLGALASKPVMEGKAVLFKRFADIDGIDIEVGTEDVDAFCQAVKLIAPSFGGINLEDISAPASFLIEARLKDELDIPVMHDDQHGTAIIAAAGLINACLLTGRDLKNCRIVSSGAGAASIATVELLKAMGVPHDHVTLVDRDGVIYRGRADVNQWKAAHAVDTDARSLADALDGADVFLGLSAKGVVSQDMVKAMAPKPIVFAMANPDPEILPEDVKAVRPDAIIATGRSDYPNQVNNVLGFPYIFRGALDVRASAINTQMKVAAVYAIAELARKEVPGAVAEAYGAAHTFGPEYIIPAPFDPRLITVVPKAVAKAAMDTGVARKPIMDMAAYEARLKLRIDPNSERLQTLFDAVRANPQRAIFAEGEEETMIRAALAYQEQGYGQAILVGREREIEEVAKNAGIDASSLEIVNAKSTIEENDASADCLFARLQRKGFLWRDCQRMIKRDRNVYAAMQVVKGRADLVITGLTKTFRGSYEDIKLVLDHAPGQRTMGYTMVLDKTQTVFLADTSIHENPTAQQLVAIAKQMAWRARSMGHEPRVAFVSYSTFGNPMRSYSQPLREAVELLDQEKVDFEYEGEMQVTPALDFEMMRKSFPFSRLSGPANILIMPGLHAANISSRLIQHFSKGKVVGPQLLGMEKPVHIALMNAKVDDILTSAAIAAHSAIIRKAQ